jgi:hypothetical protein
MSPERHQPTKGLKGGGIHDKLCTFSTNVHNLQMEDPDYGINSLRYAGEGNPAPKLGGHNE